MYLAMKSLIYTLLLLIVLTFICAVVFKNFSDVNEGLKDAKYDSVGGAFWNLMIYGTFLDGVGDMLNILKDLNIGYALFFIGYIFIANLTMLNMLIGVLCEVSGYIASRHVVVAACRHHSGASKIPVIPRYTDQGARH